MYYPETSVTNLSRTTPQKSEELNYKATEASTPWTFITVLEISDLDQVICYPKLGFP
jgi:hypothetical protein